MESRFGIDRLLREIDNAQEAKEKGEVPKIVLNVIEQALTKLRATKCAFKVMLPNGTLLEHDSHKFDPPKVEIKRKRKYANGVIKNYYWPLVKNLQVGDVAEVPCTAEFSASTLQSAVSAQLGHEWGKGSYSTSFNKNTNKLEVLRLN